MRTALGTPGYQCPELLEGGPYNGVENDIFACGVILFIIFCGFPPFREATKYDPWYRHFQNNNPDLFWQMHGKQKRSPKFSDSFKQLINGMLSANSRFPSMEEVMKTSWYNEVTADQNEVHNDMKNRKEVVDRNRAQSEDRMEVDATDGLDDKGYRGGDDDAGLVIETIDKKLEELSIGDFSVKSWKENPETVKRSDYMLFSLSPKQLYYEIVHHLAVKFHDIKLDFSLDSYKIKARYSATKQEDLESMDAITELDLNIEIFQDDKGSVVQFYKNEAMIMFEFKQFLNEFRASFEKK
jgi:hypothetical protein